MSAARPRQEALAALARRYPEDYRRIYQSIKDGEPISEITVAEWAEKWLVMRQQVVRPGTWVSDRSAVKWIVKTIGDKPLAGLAPSDMREVQFKQAAAGHSPTTVERSYRVLKLMLRDASEEGYEISERALRTRKVGKPARVDRQALPLEDARKILEVALKRRDSSRWVAALLQGMRPSEALGLRWSNVNLEEGIMTIEWQLKNLPYNEPRNPASGFRAPHDFESIHLKDSFHLVRPKTFAGVRTVPLVPWLRTELITWAAIAPPSPYDLVWPADNGGPMSSAVDRDEWYSMCEEADVWMTRMNGTKRPPLLYECRHTAATLLMASGADEKTLISILGHSKITATKAYLHTDETRKLAALETVGAQLGLHQ